MEFTLSKFATGLLNMTVFSSLIYLWQAVIFQRYFGLSEGISKFILENGTLISWSTCVFLQTWFWIPMIDLINMFGNLSMLRQTCAQSHLIKCNAPLQLVTNLSSRCGFGYMVLQTPVIPHHVASINKLNAYTSFSDKLKHRKSSWLNHLKS